MTVSSIIRGFCIWRRIISIAVVSTVVCIALPAESSDPATQPTGGPTATTAPREGPLKHLKIDRQSRRVIVDAKVMLQKGEGEGEGVCMLEFLMCRTGAKDHETLLTTGALPSSLHAALLAMGLAPGRPAQWVTPEGEKPVFISPAGAALIITVQWTDKSGKVREVPATDWMMDVATTEKMHETRWIFVGSDFLDDGRYWADIEGLHISVTNFASSVIDVPFRSTSEDALREFAVNTAVVPPKGTPVKLIIKVAEGAETAPAARMAFDIDAFGRIKLDGSPVVPEDVSRSVRQFLSRHADASADVRTDPLALVFDRERLREILEQAGLTRITFTARDLRGEILPRTPEQADRAIAWWKEHLSQADDLLIDPAEDAAATLQHIKRRIKEVEALSELWADYAAGLKKAMDQHLAQQKKKESDQ